MNEIRYPFAWSPEELKGGEFALEVLKSPARFCVINWHRKGKKTLMAINKLAMEAALVQGTYGYIAPTQKLALDIVWNDVNMLARNLPPDVWNSRNKTEKFISFPNGSILYVRGSDEPDNLRGPNWRGVVFDEYSYMKETVFNIVKPAIANNQGWAWFLSTPNGPNDFKAKADYAKTSGDKNWAYFEMAANQSGILTKQELEDERKTMPEAFWRQEYFCEFSSNALRVFSEPRKLIRKTLLPQHGKFQVGWDLAKSVDWTVGYAVDLTKKPYQVHLIDRWQGADWNLTKARIESSYFRLNKPKGRIDSTGVGDPIFEDLSKTCRNLNGFKFTQESRKQLIDNLIIQMEQGNLFLPNDDGLMAELEAFRFMEQNSGGKKWFRAECPSSMTDDRVCALALACWELPERPLPASRQDNQSNSESFNRFEVI
jgi:phage FluMu gp28-like protein